MRIRKGIQFRLRLLAVLPAGLLGLAFAACLVQSRISDLDRDLGIRGDLIVHPLVSASVALLPSGDRAALQSLVDSALREEGVVEIAILDRPGDVLVSGKNPHGANPTEPDDRWVRTEAIRLASPVGDDRAEPLGFVRLIMSSREVRKQRQQANWLSAGVLLAGLLVAGRLARRMGRKISEPVAALTAAVQELSRGNMDARVETDAVAELAYLQAGFNAMAAELKKSRRSLEQQVEQATARLRDALESLKQRNCELEAAHREAEAQAELKSRFIAQMSHEIRTPMNGVIGFAELLANTSLRREQAEQLGLIRRSAKNLLVIVNEILDLSKLEAGKINLDLKNFELRPCLEDVISLLSVRVRQVPIALWFDPHVPKVVRGDPVRIQQVLANLLGNAIKFTCRGRIVVRVRRLRRIRGDRLMFSVSDSGIGISAEDRRMLFSPVPQSRKSPVDFERGAGLGLSISKHIVENMGGNIRVASRPGRGTSVWFDLPLLESDGEAEPDSLVSLGPRAEARPVHLRSAWKCLVADDNEINRLLLSTQLKKYGAEIVESRNGLDALERVRQQSFDVILLDLQMPAMDGPQVLREVRDNPGPNRQSKIIAITAFCAPGCREFLIQAGFDDCLIKPIAQVDLARIMASAGLEEGKTLSRWAGIDVQRSAEDHASAIVEKTGGNRELAAVIARKLFAELPECLHHLTAAIHAGDEQDARQMVHKINGSAGFSGLAAIRQAAARLEFALAQREGREMQQSLCQKLRAEIESFLSRETVIIDTIMMGRALDG